MSCGCDIKIINEENKIIVTEETNVIVVSHADGRDGKSAYQQAVEGGYTGTEQEFNCSLSMLADVAEGKKQIADAINTKGGSASADSSFSQLAEDVLAMPTSGILANGITQTEPFSFLKYLTSNINNEITEINNNEITTIVRPFAFYKDTALREVVMNNLVTISGSSTFLSCASLQNIELGTLTKCVDPFSNTKTNLRNITIGQDTDVDLPFQNWTATNVIIEGPSDIDELNNNLRTNLLEKLADHSTDGQTRTLRLGWLAYVTQENIDYANSKGWTLTT